jgi:hypothetical protein
MKDLLGRGFEIGQLVAYGGRSGSGGSTGVGRVVKINDHTLTLQPIARYNRWSDVTHWIDAEERAVSLQRPKRAIILDSDFTAPKNG